MPSKILDIQHLATKFHVDFGTVYAVNDVSYSIDEGETVGIVGESGCGKSVSMLSIMRLLHEPPAEVRGKVIFQGLNLFELPASDMRRLRGSELAMIFQDPMSSLNPVLTIGIQLTESLQVHLGMSKHEAHLRAVDLLEMVGISQPEERLDAYPHQFSGGMRQRVMIAIALACNPALLIADEPTTSLDVTIQAQIIELVKDLRNRFGMTLIWITHDLGVVAGLVDRVLVMYAGFVVEDAQVDELYNRPLHPYTLALLRSVPRMDLKAGSELDSIEGLPPNLTELPEGCAFAPRCPLVKDLCHGHRPPLLELGGNHRAACWVNLETGELRHDLVDTVLEK